MKKTLLVTIAMATAVTMATASMSDNLSEDDTSAQQWTEQTVQASDSATEGNLNLLNNVDNSTDGYMKNW